MAASLEPAYHGGQVPDELKRLDQWVAWRYEERGGKRTKVPRCPRGGPASSTDPATWGTFAEACRAARGLNGGVGFVLTALDAFVVIDLDGCFVDGELAAWARDIVTMVASYTEISPSGDGLHIWVKGKLPTGRRRIGAIELYDDERFMTFTGKLLIGELNVIAERQAALDALYARLFPAIAPAVPPPVVPTTLADDALLHLAGGAANGQLFRQLFVGGDASSYGGDGSRADLALCGILNFWTGNDLVRTDALFRRSALMRPKWDERRGGTTYGALTLAKAMSGEIYRPSPPVRLITAVRPAVDEEPGPDERALLGLPGPTAHLSADRSDRPPVSCAYPDSDIGNALRLLDKLGGKVRHITVANRFHLYRDGVWAQDKTATVDALALSVSDDLALEAEGLAAEGDAAGARRKHKAAVHAASAAGTTAMLKQLARMDGVRASMGIWNPDKHLICCLDCVIDLRTKERLPHDPAYLMTHQVRVAWDGGHYDAVAAPVWQAFLESSLVDASGATDREKIWFLQRWGGYSITRETREQVFLMLFGKPSSGKGVFAHTAGEIFHDFTTTAGSQVFLAGGDRRHASEVAKLDGPRIILTSEVNHDDVINPAQVKRMTGEDQISANFMRQDSFDFRLVGKIMMLANQRAMVDDDSNGFWRRLLVLEFPREFEEMNGAAETALKLQWDPKLKEKLVGEYEAILKWFVDGAREWYQVGLHIPAVVRDAAKGYRQSQDVVLDFIERKLVLGDWGLGVGESARVEDVWQAWRSFQLDAAERSVPARVWHEKMTLHGMTVALDADGVPRYRGVQVRN